VALYYLRPVLEIVGGYNLDLRCSPVQTALPLCTIQSSEHVEVSNLLRDFFVRGIIEHGVSEPGEYISPIFTRPKPDGRIRLILNLKGFNILVNHVHFKQKQNCSWHQLI
jgi:hypothetical protein